MRHFDSMSRALSVATALLTASCTLLLEPDRSLIVRFDASVDAGPDFDAGFDAGPDFDAGFDAGCIPAQELEVSCSDGTDNDCDGVVDCSDSDCAGDGYCCDLMTGTVWQPLADTPYENWDRFGSATIESGDRVGFDTATGQLVLRTCAPLAFGMRILVDFDVESIGGDGDYASLVLAPVNAPRAGGTLLSDLALRVIYDEPTRTAHATLERAGTVIGSTSAALNVGTHQAIIRLRPSVDERGRPVLLVSAIIAGQRLATRETLMPLSDLVGVPSGCAPDGLFIAVEGYGAGVRIDGAAQAFSGNCANPTQFIADTTGPLGEDPILAPGTWRAGGAGEPALLATSPRMRITTDRVELLVDASETERSDELLRFVNFSIGGAVRSSSGWLERTPGTAELLGPSPSSREPSLATGAALDPNLIAFARATSPDVFEIAYANLGRDLASSPESVRPLLGPASVTCRSLRDPALVAIEDRNDVLLFFTCERMLGPPTVGVARLRNDGISGFAMVGDAQLDLFPTSAVGDFGRQGVFSPEVVVSQQDSEAGTYRLRIWFLARDAGGQVTVGFAFGEVDVDPLAEGSEALPRVSLYPGNPVLRPEDQVIGGACPLGCTIDSLGVTATEGVSPLWTPPLPASYLFLVERSRFRSDGVDHQLVPIRQPRPAGG